MDLGNKALLVVHALSAAVLTGAVIHNGLLAFGRRALGRPLRPRLRRLYPAVAAVTFMLTFGLGLWLYPAFRVDVRAAWLDAAHPLLVAAFEVKEHQLAIAGMMLLYLVPTARRFDRGKHAQDDVVHDVLSVALALVVSLATLTGLVITSMRPV